MGAISSERRASAARGLSDFLDDPRWAEIVPDFETGGPKCGLVPHEDCTPLAVDDVAAHLMPGGTLGTMRGYEARPGQIDMLRAVARAFNAREHLMVEAGTGVGKSLAYLVPAVHWAATNDTPVIVSTATRNLQSQLVAQDIPRAIRTLPEPGTFRAALLKGRTNYLCLHALGEFLQDGYFAMTDEERTGLEAVAAWIQTTGDGDLDTLDVTPEIRRKLLSDGEDCGGRRCPHYAKCFVRKARERAAHAHLVVANHSLVLTEAANPGSGLLPAYARIVFDEAHDLEDIVTDFFSFEFSRVALSRLLGKLARTTHRRSVTRTRGFLGAVERLLQKGTFSAAEHVAEAVGGLCKRAHKEAALAAQAGDDVFETLRRLFEPDPTAEKMRFRARRIDPTDSASPLRRQYARNGLFADYPAAMWDEAVLARALVAFEHHLACVSNVLTDMARTMAEAEAEIGATLGDLVSQAQGLSTTFRDWLAEAKFALAGADEEHVYWVEKEAGHPGEKGARGRRKNAAAWSVRVTAAPLAIAKEMRACFLDQKDSVVFASATLRVGDRFDYLSRKLGTAAMPGDETADDPPSARVKFLTAASPFDYFRQVYAAATAFLPEPGSGAIAAHAAQMSVLLRDLFTVTGGRGLVLFTAYEMMRAVAEATRPLLEAAGLELLVQGEGLTREAMTARLKGEHGTVIFGASSFWEGVDVPGTALTCVVIARLPFPQVGEPIVEARCEKIAEAGGSPFRDYMLPEAVIAFKQGFGRLVRARTDRGLVIIADSRIVTKNYGAFFRKAAPATVSRADTPEALLAQVRVRYAEMFGGDAAEGSAC